VAAVLIPIDYFETDIRQMPRRFGARLADFRIDFGGPAAGHCIA